MTYILRTNQLTKTYREKEVVRNVSMNVQKGEIYGFLGPNGAGKTTVMKMMTNLVKPTRGEVEIFGEKWTNSSYEPLKRMGIIIENPIFFEKLTARENLNLHCEYMGFHNRNAINEALELVNLNQADSKPVREFSLGMKQRLGIARAITIKPELLILDEPINGLDPIGIREFRDLFKMLNKEFNITLLISSHILGEIEQLADTIGVIREGLLLEEMSMESIRGSHTEFIEVVTDDVNRAAFVLEHTLHISNFKVLDSKLVRIYDAGMSSRELIQSFIANGIAIETISKKNQTLDDYFYQLIHGEVTNVEFN
ncbi:ABC transporter ATP-binding protein [Paenibacillus spongiae]|uniref:ABC transporter ATP-binding protein n=1 Tax=Paenibacillus spongiae TaxID=2909671 RepID=A0ABY5S606_9BACL|nr:ABC transporter ATP-binding protein [Paenibacillus spongiae]UVI29099.1 ABC transporter ATP-binding protein [Paenibacillus spongiae]